MNSCDSGCNYSNSSSAARTARTRFETIDSINAYDVDADADVGVNYGYDLDHGTNDPLRTPPKNNKHKRSSSGTDKDGEATQAPSQLTQCARSVHRQWVYVTTTIRDLMLRSITSTAMVAARYPRPTLIGITILSFALVAVGYFTNFEVRLDNEKLFTPSNSEVLEYEKFTSDRDMYLGTDQDVNVPAGERRLQISRNRTLPVTISVFEEGRNYTTIEYLNSDNEANANTSLVEVEEEESKRRTKSGRMFSFLMHANQENVFTIEGILKVFDAIDRMRAMPRYDELCSRGDDTYVDYYGKSTCEIKAITRFWNHNRTLFTESIKTEEDLFDAADAVFYPDDGLVDLPFVLAEMKEDEFGRPIYGEAFYGWFFLKSEFDLFENLMTDNLMGLRNEWLDDSSNIYRLEFAGITAFEREAKTAIMGDLPLLPVVFIIMCLFTCLVFFKWHRVQSRSLLGIGAVVTIVMSILSGYGLMFLFGKSIGGVDGCLQRLVLMSSNVSMFYFSFMLPSNRCANDYDDQPSGIRLLRHRSRRHIYHNRGIFQNRPPR